MPTTQLESQESAEVDQFDTSVFQKNQKPTSNVSSENDSLSTDIAEQKILAPAPLTNLICSVSLNKEVLRQERTTPKAIGGYFLIIKPYVGTIAVFSSTCFLPEKSG